MCTLYAFDIGAQTIGLTDGEKCYCGTSGKYSDRRDDVLCDLKCPGNRTQNCGSEEYYAIYEDVDETGK